MALLLCLTCGRKQYHLLPTVCSGHSELRFSSTGRVIAPADPTKVLIPTYKAEVRPSYQPPVKINTQVKTGLFFKDSTKIDTLLDIAHTKPTASQKCSFCESPVDHTNITRGITKPRKILQTEEVLVDDHLEIVEKIIHVPSKVIACPGCVLLITPFYNRCRFCKGKSQDEIAQCFACKGTKQGEMIQATEFPQFD